MPGIVVAWIAGARGISRWGVAGQVALVAGYFVLRFVVLHIGSPQLEERSRASASMPTPTISSRASGATRCRSTPTTSARPSRRCSPRSRAASCGWPKRRSRGQLVGPATLNVVASLWRQVIVAMRGCAARLVSRQTDRADQVVIVPGGDAERRQAPTQDVILSPAGVFFALALASRTPWTRRAACCGAWPWWRSCCSRCPRRGGRAVTYLGLPAPR